MKVHTTAPGRGANQINIYRTGLIRCLDRPCKPEEMGKFGYALGKTYFFFMRCMFFMFKEYKNEYNNLVN